VCYYNGDGVQQDYAEAVYWFSMAATQGHAEALDSLERNMSSRYGDRDYGKIVAVSTLIVTIVLVVLVFKQTATIRALRKLQK